MIELVALLECYNTYDQSDIYFDVAKSILENYNHLNTSNLQDFADSIHISISTANRFIKQLYYENFSMFRTSCSLTEENYQHDGRYYPAIREESIAPEVYGEILSDKIKEVMSSIDKEHIEMLVSMIENSDKIVFIGIPMSSDVWRLQVELVLMGKKTSAFIDPNYQVNAIELVDEKSLVICLQYMRQQDNYYEELLKKARQKGAKTVYIANVKKQNVQGNVDMSLVYEGTNTHLDALIMQVILNYLGSFLRNIVMKR